MFAAPGSRSRAGLAKVFMQPGAGAITRPVRDKLGETISVKDFGAVGNGIANDTAAIQAAITACAAAGGGTVFFPRGTYIISSPIAITTSGIYLQGESQFASEIFVVSTSTNVFEFKTAAGFILGNGFRDIGIFGFGTQTNGAAIYLQNAGDFVIENVRIQNTFRGILVDMGLGGAGRIERVHQSDIVFNAFLIISTNELGISNCSTFRSTGGDDAAIRISHGAGIHISDCSLGGSNHAIAIEPGNGQQALNIWVSDCDLDTSRSTALRVAKVGTGIVRELLFSNNRYGFTNDGASGGKGITLDAATHVTFIGGHVIANILSGVAIVGGSDLHFIGVTVAGNNVTDSATEYGYDISGGDGIEIIGGMSGTYKDGQGVSDNQRYGINIQAGFTGVLTVVGVDLRGNVTGAINNASASANIVQFNNQFTGAPIIKSVAAGYVSNVGLKSSHASDGVGYTTGAGGAVTQQTNKAAAVTLDRPSGQITMNNAALAAGATVAFVLTNATYNAATDVVHAHHASGGSAFAYDVEVRSFGANAITFAVTNTTGGSLSEAIVINFVVIKGAAT